MRQLLERLDDISRRGAIQLCGEVTTVTGVGVFMPVSPEARTRDDDFADGLGKIGPILRAGRRATAGLRNPRRRHDGLLRGTASRSIGTRSAGSGRRAPGGIGLGLAAAGAELVAPLHGDRTRVNQ